MARRYCCLQRLLSHAARCVKLLIAVVYMNVNELLSDLASEPTDGISRLPADRRAPARPIAPSGAVALYTHYYGGYEGHGRSTHSCKLNKY